MSTIIDFERGAAQRVYTMLRHNTPSFLAMVVLWGIVFYLILRLSVGTLLNQIILDRSTSEAIPSIIAGLLSLWLNSRARLVVYDNGLESRGPFDDLIGSWKPHLFSTWENLSHFEIVEEGDAEDGVSYRRVLCLKRPIRNRTSIDVGRVLRIPYRKYKVGSWLKRRTIRVVDADKFAQSDFGQDIQQYAPHVIEAARQEQARVENLIAGAPS